MVAEALRLTLAEAGHTVVGVAADAPEAVRLAGDERPDVALVDVQLAHGTSGVDAARTMRTRHGTPSLFVTANPEAARFARDIALGCVTKPFTDQDVCVALRAVEVLLRGETPAPARGFELF